MRIGVCNYTWIAGLAVGGLGGCTLPVGKPEPDPAALRAALGRRGVAQEEEAVRWGQPGYWRTQKGTDLPAVVRAVRVEVGEGDRWRVYFALTDFVPLEIVEPGMLAGLAPPAVARPASK